MQERPFSLYKRKDKPCFYVQFKSNTGYLPPKSTKQTSEAEAIKTAWGNSPSGIVPYTGVLNVSGKASEEIISDVNSQSFSIFSEPSYVTEGTAFKVYKFTTSGKEQVGSSTIGTGGTYQVSDLQAKDMYMIELDTNPKLATFVFGQGNVTFNIDPISSAAILTVTDLMDYMGIFNKNINAAYFAPFFTGVVNDARSYYTGKPLPDLSSPGEIVDAVFSNFSRTTAAHLVNLVKDVFKNDNYPLPVISPTGIDTDPGAPVRIENLEVTNSDNTTLNIKINFKEIPATPPNSDWESVIYPYANDDLVNNKNIIEILFNDENALTGERPPEMNFKIRIFKGTGVNQWEAAYVIQPPNAGEDIVKYLEEIEINNNSIEFAIPLHTYMRRYFLLNAAVATIKGTANSSEIMSMIPAIRVDLR
ncbi:hypothetical protein NO2_0543 [Candidatus Termititenax persephonae]|uniref:Uncharacterized protein n=1 Tax=Candidatus Termititenax persephonae TaxID=2218525 RepID=A0A388TGI9_9BACT|nr:hypothetical protein NO2_0543 [Candidatus Termititenax persephonae]